MSNQRVTQLTAITATEIASDDLFLVADISAYESKKMTATQLGTYLNISGSTYVPRSVLADTASFVAGSNVVGAVPTASLALLVTSASYAKTASLVTSASHAVIADTVSGGITTSVTSSYLNYTAGSNTGTASFALTASFVKNASSSSFVVYTGVNNGTVFNAITASSVVSSSFAISASFSISSSTADLVTLAVSCSIAKTASYLMSGPPATIDSASHADWADTATLAVSATDAYNSTFAGSAINSTWAVFATSSLSSSYASASWSSSFATTASYATSASYEIIYETSASYAETASVSISSSHADVTDNISFTTVGNTVIGVDAITGSTSKFDVTIIGNSAAKHTNNGVSGDDGATIIGAHAAENVLTTYTATVVGSYAGQNCKELSGATLIGRSAGSYPGYFWGATIVGSGGPWAGTCSFATMVGSLAGYDALTASNATFIGRGADAAASNLNVEKSVAIGYNAKVSGSNMCVLGGIGADAVKVGIGIALPTHTLEVVGNISSSLITASIFAPSGMVVPTTATATTSSVPQLTGSMIYEVSTNLLFIYSGLAWKSASFA